MIIPCVLAVMLLQTDGRKEGGGVNDFHWSMLRNAYAQQPLDGTSETRTVLLRLLEDGLVGAVSITLQLKAETGFHFLAAEVRKRGKRAKTTYFVSPSGFNVAAVRSADEWSVFVSCPQLAF